MRGVLTLSIILSLFSGVALAQADVAPEPKVLEALESVSLVDVMECHQGDTGSLSSLRSISEIGGKKKSKKARKAERVFEERLMYWAAILSVASEDELIAAKAGVEHRRAERKKKRESMSVMDAAVYMARQDYPCDDIFEEAK
ncbi:MAG: hypothetical protein ABJN22_07055 [Litorimonas sp.]